MSRQHTRQPRCSLRKSSIVFLQLLPRRSRREIQGQTNHVAPGIGSWHELSLFPNIRNIHFGTAKTWFLLHIRCQHPFVHLVLTILSHQNPASWSSVCGPKEARSRNITKYGLSTHQSTSLSHLPDHGVRESTLLIG